MHRSYVCRSRTGQCVAGRDKGPFTPSESSAKAKNLKDQAKEIKEKISSIKENFH